MATKTLNGVVQHLRRSALQQAAARLLDGELLERYISGRDDAAFEALVRRHGAMVLGVCQRILRNHADAEDAFQATFLVLVRKAGSIRKKGAVANWLYGVAHHTALKARAMNQKRRRKELVAGTMSKPQIAEEVWHQVQALVDGELSLLPENYRTAIVLCDLEGKTIKEAAAHLGWPQGTLATRLRRGRRLLAGRLAPHGLALSGAALAAALSPSMAPAAVSPPLVAVTLRAAALLAAGKHLCAGGIISTNVAALTEGVLKAMLLTKLKSATAVLLVLAVLAAGAGGVSQSANLNDGQVPVQPGNAPAQAARPGKDVNAGTERLLISSQVKGIIVEVSKPGDKVRTGRVVARLDDRAAKAAVDSARARVEAAKADHAAAAARLDVAVRRAQRLKVLLDNKAIAEAECQEALDTREQARADLSSRSAALKRAEGDLKEAQVRLTRFVLRSPVAGTVRAVFHRPGELIEPGQRLLEIAAKPAPKADQPQRDRIDPGESVKAGDPLGQIGAKQAPSAERGDRDQLDPFRARIDTLEAEVERLRDRAAWSTRMLNRGYVGDHVAEVDRRNLAKAKQALEDARRLGGEAVTALAGRFRYRVPVEIGHTEFNHGGRIDILEVWGTRPRIEVGGQYLVRGKYVLPPGKHGKLYFYETATGGWSQPTATLDLQSVEVDKEKGGFVLMHGMAGPGYFHLVLAAPEDYSRMFANVYFGTGDNVLRTKP
jgi:RNA polymerase sigma factor (sigma-70 family)